MELFSEFTELEKIIIYLELKGNDNRLHRKAINILKALLKVEKELRE